MDGVPTPGGTAPKKGKMDRRKLMIYGGVGAALLLLLLLSRRGSSSSTTTDTTGTFPSAASSIPTGTGGGDGGGSTGVGGFDNSALQSTLDQLPGAVKDAVSAGVQSGLGNASPASPSDTTPSARSDIPDFVTALGASGLALTAGGGRAGEQNGPATTAGGGRTAKSKPDFTTKTVQNPKTHRTQTEHVYADHTVVISSKPTLPNTPTGGAHKQPAAKPTASTHPPKKKH